MQKEVKNFLEHIQFDASFFQYFQNATIVKALSNKDKNQIVLTIEIPTILDVRIYGRLRDCMQKVTPTFNVIFLVKELSLMQDIALHAYYYYFLEAVFSTSLIYENLRKIKPYLKDQNIVFPVPSPLLMGTLNEIKPQFEQLFHQAGFHFPIQLVITAMKEDQIDEEVEEERKVLKKKALRIRDAQLKVVATNQYDKGYYRKREKDRIEIQLKDLKNEDTNVAFTARIFKLDVYESRSSRQRRYNIFLTDDSDAVMMSLVESAKFTKAFLESLQVGTYVRTHGDMEFSQFSRDYTFKPQSIEVVEFDNQRYDDEVKKRVELHLHTTMSTMDAVGNIEDYIDTAVHFGHKALAITDHGGIQIFPKAQAAAKGKPIKLIYGMEGYVIEDRYTIAYQPKNVLLDHATYVAFDLETTGLSSRHDAIIEFGAVRIRDGLIVERFQTFINPKRKLPEKIRELTGIKDEMLIHAPSLDEVMPVILNFIQDSILVAHNATFDVGFINQYLDSRGKQPLENGYIDTMNLAKCLYPTNKSYALGAVSRSFGIDYDENVAHRGDYDAEVVGNVFIHMMSQIITHNHIKTHEDLNQLNREDSYKTMRPFHMNFLVINEEGLKNLYRLVTISHTQYITHLPLIPRGLISNYRQGLLIGSSCFNGEIFDIAMTKSQRELEQAVGYYDFIEIQPLENYSWLIDTERIENQEKLIVILKDIISAAQNQGIMVVATGDVHYVDPEDKVFRDVYIYAQSVGARRHPLYDFRRRVKSNPNQHYRTTKEMLESYPYLDEETVKMMVIDHPNQIADQIQEVFPIKDHLYTPRLEGIDAEKEVIRISLENLEKWYGKQPPFLVKERLERELKSIRENDFGVIYYLAYRLVKNSKDEGYLVGSRGSVGSSFVATLCGITEVNPLPPHYLCPHCQYTTFEVPTGTMSGYDLADIPCPRCGTLMRGEGQNIPFETFLGIEGDKVPDIDLNFSREYQARAHNFTKVLLGENNVFRAGTISTVADKTAFGYVRNYFEEIQRVDTRLAEIERLALNCKDVKRTTGQHPGGIIVVPQDKDVHDFTPIQYPADESDATWKTTHYPYQAIHDEILKLDLLGHVDPSALRMLYDITGIDPEEIPMNDEQVLSLFTSTKALGVEPYQILNDNGTAGIPEFGTPLVKNILKDAKPRCFSELVQISGISHGTNVWRGNAQDLIQQGICSLMDVIGCRDDIMTYLVAKGMEHRLAFRIMESVRKGKGLTAHFEQSMLECDVPEWYIKSCKKIEYMFPKAHAAAYVRMALRVAWYKVYRPLAYYAAFFTLRCDAYELDTMIAGYDAIKKRFKDIKERLESRTSEMTNKEKELYEVLQLALEMTARGMTFANLSLEHSAAKEFVMDEEKNQLIPPFIAVDGLGESAANSIIEARQQRPFLSKQDLMSRTSVNQTHLKVFEAMRALEQLQEENQLTLDLF